MSDNVFHKHILIFAITLLFSSIQHMGYAGLLDYPINPMSVRLAYDVPEATAVAEITAQFEGTPKSMIGYEITGDTEYFDKHEQPAPDEQDPILRQVNGTVSLTVKQTPPSGTYQVTVKVTWHEGANTHHKELTINITVEPNPDNEDPVTISVTDVNETEPPTVQQPPPQGQTPDGDDDTTSQPALDGDTTPQTTPDDDAAHQSTTSVAGTGEAGQIVISEIMFESEGGLRSLPQWIELYNTTDTDINIRRWQLEWYRREPKLLDVTTTFETDFTIPAKAARLVCSIGGRVSGHKELQNRDDQRYLLFRYHSTALDQKDGQNRNRLIARGGFYLKLRDGEDTLIDEIGTVADKTSEPAWELPDSDIDGARSSLIRRFDEGTVRPGTERSGWIRAYDTTARPTGRYYGRATDIGTPAYRSDEMPLPVTLSHFRAEQTDTGVLLKWITQSELDNAGFYIYRSQTKAGEFKVVNPTMIQGAGTTSERTEYTWTDTTAKPNTVYYYRIEDISHDGDRKELAIVGLRGFVSAKGKFITKWSELKRTPAF